MKKIVVVLICYLMVMSTKGTTKVSLSVNWNEIKANKTSADASIEVVSSALLSGINCPRNITDRLWQTLSELGAKRAKYLGWFVFPKYSVGELEEPAAKAPSSLTTAWDMKLIAPMVANFFKSTTNERVISMATQPSWVFTPQPPNALPKNPDEPMWNYANGSPVASKVESLVAYYSVLWKILSEGSSLDETGKWNISSGIDKMNITHWEIFNENEHEFLPGSYSAIYDSITAAIISATETQKRKRPMFIGIGGASPSRIKSFLKNAKNPIDAISLHFRTTSKSRSQATDYEEFYSSAKWYSKFIKSTVIPILQNSTQKPELHINQVEFLLPMDNSVDFSKEATQSAATAMFYSASGGAFAELFAELTQIGVTVVGMGQLSGYPAIPEWNITQPFYPSLSMTDWNTGRPNSRYWVLKLLIDKFEKESTTFGVQVNEQEPSNPFCGISDSRNGFPDITLECSTKGEIITSIDFASFGLPHGICGNYSADAACNPDGVLSFVNYICIEKHSCVIPVFPFAWEDPCEGFVETLRVQARCGMNNANATTDTTTTGKGVGKPRDIGSIYSVAFITKQQQYRILVVNRRYEDAVIDIAAKPFTHGIITTVNDLTPSTGPIPKTLSNLSDIHLRPFATSIIDLLK